MYARQPVPWANLANAETQIGRQDLSIEPPKRAIALDVKYAAAYVTLARAQFGTGRLDDALATCEQAIVQEVDGTDIHGLLFQIGFAQHDRAAMSAQLAWAKGTPSEPYSQLQQAFVAFAEGRPGAAVQLIGDLADGYRKRGMVERANRMRGGLPRLVAELDMTDTARTLLRDLPPIDGSTDIPVALAEVGQDSRAEAILDHDLKKFPDDTLWQYMRGPEIQAAIWLSCNKPEKAIEALRRAIPYDLRIPEIRAWRGRAYLAARQYSLAATEFRKIID